MTARAECSSAKWRQRKTSGRMATTRRRSPYMVRDAEAFARNLARAVEQGRRALAAYLKTQEKGKAADLSPRRPPRSSRRSARSANTGPPTRPADGGADPALHQLFHHLAERHGAGRRQAAAGGVNSGRPPLQRPRLDGQPDVLRAEADLSRHHALGRAACGRGRRHRRRHPPQGALLSAPDQQRAVAHELPSHQPRGAEDHRRHQRREPRQRHAHARRRHGGRQRHAAAAPDRMWPLSSSARTSPRRPAR